MTCAKRNCAQCATVEHTDAEPAPDAKLTKLLSDAAQPDSCWDDNTPWRYAWPTTD